MRIALIVPGGVDRGGRERVIPVLLALIERLARRHQVLVVALKQEKDWCRYPLLGATVVNLGEVNGLGRVARWMIRLRRLMASLRSEGGRFDVLHAFWVRSQGSLAVAAGRLLRVPVIVSIGGGELVWLPSIGYGGQGSWLGRAESSLTLRMAQIVSGASQYALKPCLARRPDALWVPLGVDLPTFDGPADRDPGPPWRLLQVADLNLVKDQLTLLKAIRMVASAAGEVHLDCIGVDTLDNRCQQAAASLGLDGCVTFRGFQPLDAIIPFYRRAHLFVQSSVHESMGAAVLEAAAAGVPTVGTAVGLVAEMSPEASVAVPVRDPQALGEAILKLLCNGPERARMGQAAQRFARTYDADWTAKQFEGLYTRLVERSSIREGADGQPAGS